MLHANAWLRQRAREEGKIKIHLTQHAKLRAEQMGVSCERLIAILEARGGVSEWQHGGSVIRAWSGDPSIRIVYSKDVSPPSIHTILWNTQETYTRPEKEVTRHER